jgi:hypothetical protein
MRKMACILQPPLVLESSLDGQHLTLGSLL